MKKIFAMALIAVTLVSSTFAIGFGIGGKAVLGKNLASEDTLKGTVTGLTKDSAFDFGGNVYANFALLGGLGVQAEANLIHSSITFATGEAQTTEYATLQLDIPLMVWLNLDLWRFTLGFGAGPNFGITLSELNELKSATKESFKMGLAAGVDLKFYFTKHLGLVTSARYIMDFKKDERAIEVSGYDTGETYPTIEYTRRSLYGGIGLEFKLF